MPNRRMPLQDIQRTNKEKMSTQITITKVSEHIHVIEFEVRGRHSTWTEVYACLTEKRFKEQLASMKGNPTLRILRTLKYLPTDTSKENHI
jgi:hypothetical protein